MNKQNILLTTLISAVILHGSIASAATQETRSKTTPSTKGRETQNVVRYSQAESVSTSQAYKLQVGLSTITNAPANYSQRSVTGGTSITGLMEISKTDSIQAFFAIPSTSGLSVDALGLYKKTLIDDGSYGLHVGAGFGLGILNSPAPAILAAGQSSSNLVLNFVGVAGIHFEVPGAPHLKIHLDGGPSITIINSTPSQTSFQLGGLSPALGLSVLYAI